MSVNMADGDNQEPRARKFHEGWIHHQPTNGKVWTKYWMVLRGNMLFIFGSDRTGKDEMRGTLTLGPDTELRNLPPESKKKGFKFELSTTSSSNERKINRFKFDKENERDVWKAFVVGISVGIVPSDIHLLPGQLKDVHEAIGEVRNRPPPLPDSTTPRPRLGINKSQSANMLEETSNHHYNDRGYQDNERSYNNNVDGNGSDDSGSFTGHVTHKSQRSESVPNAMMAGTVPAGGVHNLRQLMHRQRDLAVRDLVGASHTAEPAEKFPFSSPFREPDTMVFNARSPAKTTSPSSASISTKHDSPSRFAFDERDSHNGFKSTNLNGNSGHFNNNQQHMFYLDAERNVEPPTWFYEVDDDSRQKAEQILTMGRRYGNVLMRTSTSFGASGKYVISMRREVAGGTKLDHYEVIKTAQGFKINVDNKHTGMRCLSDVMDFFMSVAGQGTVPMRTNDLDKVFGRINDTSVAAVPRWQSKLSPPQPSHTDHVSPSLPNHHHVNHTTNGFDSSSDYLREQNSNWILSDGTKTLVPTQSESPPMSPSSQAWSTMQAASSRRHSMDDWSSHSATSIRPANGKLNISGNVSNNILSAVHDINYGPVGNTTMGHSRVQEQSSVPIVSPPPPPPLPEPATDYPQREYANIPTMGGQEMSGFGRQHDDVQHIGQGMDHMGIQQDIPTPPQPPPLPPGGIPSVIPAALHLDNSASTSHPTRPKSSFAIPRTSISDLQDELLGKLRGRKEEIYATAQILTSNY